MLSPTAAEARGSFVFQVRGFTGFPSKAGSCRCEGYGGAWRIHDTRLSWPKFILESPPHLVKLWPGTVRHLRLREAAVILRVDAFR